MSSKRAQRSKLQSSWAVLSSRRAPSVKHCIVAENVTIEEGATVGAMPEGGLNIAEPGDVATVGSGVVIGKGATVGPKAMVSSDVKDGEEQW